MGLQIKALKKGNKWSRQQPKTQVAAQVPSDNKYFNRIKWPRERIRPEKGRGTSLWPSHVSITHVPVACVWYWLVYCPLLSPRVYRHFTQQQVVFPSLMKARGGPQFTFITCQQAQGHNNPLTLYLTLLVCLLFMLYFLYMSAVKMAFENTGGLRCCNLASDTGQTV